MRTANMIPQTDSIPVRAFTVLEAFISEQIKSYFDRDKTAGTTHDPKYFNKNDKPTPLLDFVRSNNLSVAEQTILLLALAPHVQPEYYDRIIQENLPQSGDFPQLGGARGKHFRGFLPTGETVLFLLGGDKMEKRIAVQQYFGEDHFFAKRRILWLDDVPEGEPKMSGKIVLSQEYVDLFTSGKVAKPRFSMHFPAQLLETEMEWDDLVLHPSTQTQIQDLEVWIKHHHTLMNDWEMHRKLKPGYRALFHGPPGTGKTLTASLLGKYTGREVYRIDLSMVVSKFIGETEKNLANLFAKAENKDWILFFDEADALFGKRTNVRDAHDKYANQEVSYLLQRVEQYDGLVILATNLKSNIDEAFARRFQSIIYFPIPSERERIQLWEKAFPKKVQLDKGIDLRALAQKYEMTGSEIMNITQYACLCALNRPGHQLQYEDIYEGIKKEFKKVERIVK
ncbi:ATP-binding protein [Negadavirga shengliensis]|uniref:ATP-binding protein n=1 Tax=Negadavirga shengliensis TaxID=1389218 RepID=A0ABV9T6A1_9BACT